MQSKRAEKTFGPFLAIRVEKKPKFVIEENIEKQYSLHPVMQADVCEIIINGDLQMEEFKTMFSCSLTKPHRGYVENFNEHIARA